MRSVEGAGLPERDDRVLGKRAAIMGARNDKNGEPSCDLECRQCGGGAEVVDGYQIHPSLCRAWPFAREPFRLAQRKKGRESLLIALPRLSHSRQNGASPLLVSVSVSHGLLG